MHGKVCRYFDRFPISINTAMSRIRLKAGASSVLARHVRATNGQAGWRAVVRRPRACVRRKDEQSKARSGPGPNLVSRRSRNPSADIRSIDYDRARMRAGS